MQRHKHQFDNGLTIIGEHSDSARSVAAGFFVKTGARDETKSENGVSHFLEHMMFKGTNKRSPEDVNRQFDEMGARYNAFTSEENTVYYGNVLPRFQGDLLDLLADMMRPALRESDFDLEKNVILEEIAMYQDRPQFSVFDLARDTYFGNHPLGASILGSSDSIKALQRDQMHDYFTRRYAANNLTLVLTGDYNWDAALQQAETLCGAWNTADAPRVLAKAEVQPRLRIEKSEKFNRAHIAMLAPGYAMQDAQRYAASVACEALGAGDGSRLYWALVHPGIAEAAQIGHDASDGEGTFYGYLLTAPESAQEALDVMRDTIAKACREGLTESEIERAKRRLASNLTLGAETPMGRLRAVGFDWIYRGEEKSSDDALQLLLAVTLQNVNEVLAQNPFERASIVALGPLEELRIEN